jgi:hypothetical protein
MKRRMVVVSADISSDAVAAWLVHGTSSPKVRRSLLTLMSEWCLDCHWIAF